MESVPELERETAAFWVEVADAIGFPRSVGEIYGLLFVSANPLNASDVATKLGISRSGAGQGIKALMDIGAVRPATGFPGRKEHYELQTDLGVLVRLFLNSRVLPRMEELGRRRVSLNARAKAGGHAHLVARFEKLERWRGKTDPLMATLYALAKA